MQSNEDDQLTPIEILLQDLTFDQLSQLSVLEPICANSEWYPLHVLCRMDGSKESGYIDLLKSFILSYPVALTKKTIDGFLPLHIICRNSVLDEDISVVLNANQEAARVPTLDGWFALHQVCLYCRSLKVIKETYDAYPNASNKVTERGTYPFQLLKLNKASKDASFYDRVIKSCPLLEKKQEKKRVRIPAVTAIALSKDESDELYSSDYGLQQYVISTKMFSETAKIPMEGGLYLLHVLCQQSAPLLEITEVLHAFPQAASIASEDGWLPLHIVARNTDNYKCISLILEANPEAASISTPDGFLPLHQLCRYSNSLEAIKVVYNAYRTAAEVKSPKGFTPLQLLIKYYHQRNHQKKEKLVNHTTYTSVPILAQIANSLSFCDDILAEEIESLVVSEEISVAIPMEYSSNMGLITFDDICTLLSSC